MLLCVSAARSYKPLTYLNTENGVIISGNKLKLLGFHFDNAPSAGAHVRSILQKVRYRTWIIYHLRRLGMCPAGLINVYRVLIRPCFDYSSVVYNSMLTRLQSEALERQQRNFLRSFTVGTCPTSWPWLGLAWTVSTYGVRTLSRSLP